MYKLYQMNDNKYHARITSYFCSAWVPYAKPSAGPGMDKDEYEEPFARGASGGSPPREDPEIQVLCSLPIGQKVVKSLPKLILN